jgi:hypothetical protein
MRAAKPTGRPRGKHVVIIALIALIPGWTVFGVGLREKREKREKVCSAERPVY